MLKIYFVCFTFFLIATDVLRGEPNYLSSYEAGGWLKLHTTPATWEEALVKCHDEGAVLASPLNKEIANALHSLMKQYSVISRLYLGTHDFNSKGYYESVEGVPLSNMEIKWGSHDYLVDTGDCLTLSAHGHVYYSPCENALPFICYKKLDGQTLNECGTFDNEYHLNQSTGSCYKVHHEAQSWTRAYRICAAEGGHLVILNDEIEARVVQDMFPPHTEKSNPWERFHIGLRAWGKERVWITIHGEKLQNVYNKWKPGQPDNGNGIQARGALVWSGDLDDLYEGDVVKFVCEKSPKTNQFEVLSPCTEELTSLCNGCNVNVNVN